MTVPGSVEAHYDIVPIVHPRCASYTCGWCYQPYPDFDEICWVRGLVNADLPMLSEWHGFWNLYGLQVWVHMGMGMGMDSCTCEALDHQKWLRFEWVMVKLIVLIITHSILDCWYALLASGHVNRLIQCFASCSTLFQYPKLYCKLHSMFPHIAPYSCTLHCTYIISPQSSTETITWHFYCFFIIIPSMPPMWDNPSHLLVSWLHQIKVRSHSSSPYLAFTIYYDLFPSFPSWFLIPSLLLLFYILCLFQL